MKHKFKVIIGRHIEDGKTYKKDEVVVTESPLMKLFPQKFVDLGPATEDTIIEEPAENDEETQTDPPLKPAPKKPAKWKGKGKGDDDWDD